MNSHERPKKEGDTTENENEQISLESAREQYKNQERPAFFDETVLVSNEGGENEAGDKRREPSDEERERMDKDMEELGTIFEGSDLRWQLDGARNISLMKGEYIGVHKDVDLTIDPYDLEKLEQLLFQKGYGLFLSSKHEDPKKRKMDWASAEEFRVAPDEHLMISAIDEDGRIRRDESLNHIDVHLIKRDDEGRSVGFGGAPLPEKWYEPQKVDFHGKEISLSHPAKVAYFKLHGKRGFDMTDLYNLADAGKLGLGDLDEIEDILEKEFEKQKTAVSEIIDRIAPNITADSKQEDIYDVLLRDKDVSERVEKGGNKQRVREFAELIFRQEDRSADGLKRVMLKKAGIEDEFTERREKVSVLRQRIEDTEKIRSVRDGLA